MCKRITNSGVQTLPCPSPDCCELGRGGLCKPYGRLNVKIGDDDELGTFIFRTTGFNSIRTLAARLSYYHAVSGSLLSCLPLQLRLRGKSTTQSHRSAIYYVDLTVREGMTLEESIADAQKLDARRKDCGYDQRALDEAAKKGFDNAVFEFSEEETPEIIEEFYPAATDDGGVANEVGNQPVVNQKPSLKDKLDRKVALVS